MIAPRRRWTAPRLKRTRWSMGLYVWYFGTKGTREMWSDIGHHTILNAPRYKGLLQDIFMKGRLSDDMSLYVHRPSVTDPSVAPGVGTPVRGGTTFRESHLVMEHAAASGKMLGLEMTEINPILDDKNVTAQVGVELLASALGKSTL